MEGYKCAASSKKKKKKKKSSEWYNLQFSKLPRSKFIISYGSVLLLVLHPHLHAGLLLGRVCKRFF